MIITLEEATEGRKIVLDTSATSPYQKIPIPERLYGGIKGLRETSITGLERKLDRIGEIAALNREGKLVVIREVHEEMEEELNQLTGHINFLRRLGVNGWDKKSDRRKNRRKRGRRKQEQTLDTSDREKLRLLGIYTKRKYEFLRRVRSKDPLESLTCDESEECLSYLNLAADLEPTIEIIPHPVSETGKLKHPKNLGKKLKTDQTIIAMAYYLSHTFPIVILTRDGPLGDLGIKVGEEIESPAIRQEYGIPNVQRHEIIAFNPDIINPRRENPRVIYHSTLEVNQLSFS